MLIFGLAVYLGWFPAGGFVPITTNFSGWWHSMAMPAFTLAAVQIGFIARMTRSAMLEVLNQDFIRTAEFEGPSVELHRRPTWAAECTCADPDRDRHRHRWLARRRGRGGAGIFAAGGRAVDRGCGAEPGFPRDTRAPCFLLPSSTFWSISSWTCSTHLPTRGCDLNSVHQAAASNIGWRRGTARAGRVPSYGAC